MEFKKLKFRLDSWRSQIMLPIPYENIKGLKVRWLMYQTASTGNEDLTLACSDFGTSGYVLSAGGDNNDYFFTTPLDLQSAVSCLYSNFNSELDIAFRHPIRSLHQFTIEALINGLPTNDITNSNPVVIELAFYS
jgi:hypothetical protein